MPAQPSPGRASQGASSAVRLGLLMCSGVHEWSWCGAWHRARGGAGRDGAGYSPLRTPPLEPPLQSSSLGTRGNSSLLRLAWLSRYTGEEGTRRGWTLMILSSGQTVLSYQSWTARAQLPELALELTAVPRPTPCADHQIALSSPQQWRCFWSRRR